MSQPNGAPVARRQEDEEPHTEESSEQTPLIRRESREEDDEEEQTAERGEQSAASSSLLRSIHNGGNKSSRLKRWPSLLALVILCVAIIIILVAVFVAPQVVSEYANQAVVFEPTSLSVASFTATGVVARVQGMFVMDASRVKNKSVRDFGRFGTYIARMAETKPTTVHVSLPEYGNPVVGTAKIPSVKVNLRNGHKTPIDIETKLEPGSKDAIRRVAEDWLKGNLGQLRVKGVADVSLKSGLLTLPSQRVAQSLVFESKEIPEMPDFDITRLNVQERKMKHDDTVLAAMASVTVANQYPVDFQIPPMGFELLVPGCDPSDSNIMLADAATEALHILPKEDLHVNVTGLVRHFPKAAITACPGSAQSPLDVFLGNYIHGQESTVYVRGSRTASPDTPKWIMDLISDLTVPVPFQGRSFGHLIKKFKMQHVHFDLPDLFADPDSEDSKPKISAQIKTLIGLPNEINFGIDVNRVRADADIYYEKKKFGELDLHKWREARSKPVETSKNHKDLEVLAEVVKAPLTITDSDVFQTVIQQLLTAENGLDLTVKADVDVEMETALGKLVVRKVPAEGIVPVNPIGNQDFSSLAPKVGNLAITETSLHSLTLGAAIDFSNPTNYSATVPYVDVHVSVNSTLIGHATVRNVSLAQGPNTDIPVVVIWSPFTLSGSKGEQVGAETLSQYISGYNTSLTMSMHEQSIPSAPTLGRALQNFSITLPMPNLSTPSDPDVPSDPDKGGKEEKPHFIRSTIFHLISSSAVFTLASPFKTTTMYIEHMNATAFYKGNPAGKILYDGSLEVPPGISTTPRLPVDWSFGSVGYDAIKHALGGNLKLDAHADVGVRIGEYVASLWYQGHGIGAGVRL